MIFWLNLESIKIVTYQINFLLKNSNNLSYLFYVLKLLNVSIKNFK